MNPQHCKMGEWGERESEIILRLLQKPKARTAHRGTWEISSLETFRNRTPAYLLRMG